MKCYYVTPTGTTNDQVTMVSPFIPGTHKIVPAPNNFILILLKLPEIFIGSK